MGAIWINTDTGVDGYDAFYHGTADHPVKTIACALSLAVTVGLKNIQVSSGSSITLGASAAGYNFYGKYWDLALGGQNIAAAYFEGANVTGISSGVDAWFYHCVIGTSTIAQAFFSVCSFAGTLTTIASGNYLFERCIDGIPGTTNPIFVLTANTILGIRKWSGGINLNTMAATNVSVLEGTGKLILDSNCAAGEIRLRGNWDITDNVVGGFTGTFTKTANINTSTPMALSTQTEADIDLIEDILRNKMTVTNATGAVVLYADNSSSTLLSTTLSDDSTTTTRLRLA